MDNTNLTITLAGTAVGVLCLLGILTWNLPFWNQVVMLASVPALVVLAVALWVRKRDSQRHYDAQMAMQRVRIDEPNIRLVHSVDRPRR